MKAIPAPPSHLAFLDGVRGLASLYVLLHHIWLASYPKSIGESVCGICLDAPAWSSWLRFGHLAVVAFIVVSGFSLALSPLRSGNSLPEGFLAYIKRRALRIVPPYWVALLFSCLVVMAFTGKYTGNFVDTKAVLVHGVLLNNVIDSAKPNGTFWSIAVEWQIYFVFPLLLLLCRKLGIVTMVLLTLAATILGYLLGTHHAWLAANLGLTPGALRFLVKFLHLTPQFLALFAFGVIAAQITRPGLAGLPTAISWTTVGVVMALLTMLVLWMLPPGMVESNFFWIDLLAGSATAALLAGFVQRPTSFGARLLSSAVPRWLGQSSYSLYLIHAPILEVILLGYINSQNLSSHARFVWLLVLVVPAAILASRLFWRFFERPFIRHRSVKGVDAALTNQRIAA